MTVTVETLEKLERKITLTLPADVIQTEVSNRLKRLARDVKMDGFRPGKVPMNVVAQRYGYSVHYEVMNDKVGEAFAVAANEAKLRVAGQPKIVAAGRAPPRGLRRRPDGARAGAVLATTTPGPPAAAPAGRTSAAWADRWAP